MLHSHIEPQPIIPESSPLYAERSRIFSAAEDDFAACTLDHYSNNPPSLIFANPLRKKNPLVSVITIVFNDEKNIYRTMESVIRQTSDDYEYIVIDGASTDQTVSLILDCSHSIDVFVSEPDRGIYHAQNKGLSLASGEWVIFMNSGDYFANKNVLSNFQPSPETIVAFGDSIWTDAWQSSWAAKNVHDIWKGMIACHQATFIKRDIHIKYPLSEKYKIISDYSVIAQLYADGYTFEKVPFPIARIEVAGVSDAKYSRTIERYFVARKLFPNKPVITTYANIIIQFIRKDISSFITRLRSRLDRTVRKI